MDTKQELLERALDLFAARGYESVGVQEIVDSAGVTKPPLYHHFGSKAGLLKALLEQQFDPLFVALEAASAYRGDLPLTLFHTARELVRFARARPAFHRLQLALWFAAPDSEAHRTIEPFFVRQQEILEELFANVVKDHGNLRGRHQIFARTFVAMIDAYIASGSEMTGPEADEAIRQAVKQFMYGIYAL